MSGRYEIENSLQLGGWTRTQNIRFLEKHHNICVSVDGCTIDAMCEGNKVTN